jgi:ABC-type glycerol-3-phosphate transport system substrate-binding protein
MTRTIGRSRWRALAVLAAVTALAACGSSGGSSAKSDSTTTKAATTLPKVTIKAADFSFDAPATMPAGYVDVTVENTGKEGHQVQFVKLGDGVTYDQFKTAAAKTDIGSLSTST